MPCFLRKEKQGNVFVVSSVLFLLFYYFCKFVQLVKMCTCLYRKKYYFYTRCGFRNSVARESITEGHFKGFSKYRS